MVILIESKADEQRLIDFAGEDLAKRFFAMKQRLKSPENDIYYWLKKSPEELEDRLDKLDSIKTRSQKDEEASEGAELIYNKNGWKVYHITTYEASVKYGKNTQWCISGSKRWSNGERGEEYFNNYTSKGIKFYFYIKSNNEKYALALGRNGNYQVFNQTDDEISGEGILPNVPGLPEFEVPEVKIPEVVVYTGQKLSDIERKTKKIIVKEDVTEIGDNAFSRCTSLESVTIPDSVIKIGDYAFYNCSNLISITLPDSVIEIGEYAFVYCGSLQSITIPDSVIKIGVSTFFGCTSLQSITIPDGVTEIGKSAFENCESLQSITIPDNVTEIGKWAFSRCTSLQSITIPNSVIEIGYSAFYDCPNLTIRCSEDSYAHQYAKWNDIPYEII